MNKMIKMATFAVGVGAMLSFVGCGEKNSPETAAIEGAKAHYEEWVKMGMKCDCTVKLVKMHPSGENAIVEVEVSEKMGEKTGKETLSVDVVKKDGKWVVD